VSPLSSVEPAAAPPLSSILTILSRFLLQAWCSGRRPPNDGVSNEHCCSTSHDKTSTCPLRAAQHRGVKPRSSWPSSLLPCCSTRLLSPSSSPNSAILYTLLTESRIDMLNQSGKPPYCKPLVIFRTSIFVRNVLLSLSGQ